MDAGKREFRMGSTIQSQQVVVPDGSIVLFGGNGNYSSQTFGSTQMQLEAGIVGYGPQMFVGAPPLPGSYQNDTWRSTRQRYNLDTGKRELRVDGTICAQ